LFTLESQLDLPVNYCSLVYRTRYDELAHRRRAATLANRGHDSLAESGYVRRLAVEGPAERIRRIDAALQADGRSPTLWRVGNGGSSLLFHPSLLASPELQREMIDLRYYLAEIHAGATELAGRSQPAMQVQVGPDLTLSVGERLVSTPVSFPGADLVAWLAPAGGNPGPNRCPEPLPPAEQMPRGLQRIEKAGSLLEMMAE
jgi:hypothetical protein